MRNANTILIAAGILAWIPSFALAANTALHVLPQNVIQGEPVFIEVSGKAQSISFEGKWIPSFSYEGKTSALLGIDIAKKPGTYLVEALFDGTSSATATITVSERKKEQVAFDIPAKLGGNSTSSQKNLVSTLSKENTALASLKSGTKTYWSAPFRAPLPTPVVTDEYGYNRQTGQTTITHKGTDFRAAEGTKVFAMNRGIVRMARTMGIYGKTIVIDHGQGVQTLYMHLSKIRVSEGQMVNIGQLIASSGKTGYAEFPHLHVSVRIAGISIDPMKFLALFEQKPYGAL